MQFKKKLLRELVLIALTQNIPNDEQRRRKYQNLAVFMQVMQTTESVFSVSLG